MGADSGPQRDRGPDEAGVRAHTRVLSGHRDAFGTLVDRYQDQMLAYVRCMGFGEAEACDVVQDAFIRANVRVVGGDRVGVFVGSEIRQNMLVLQAFHWNRPPSGGN